MRDALALFFVEFKFHGYNVVSARTREHARRTAATRFRSRTDSDFLQRIDR